MTVEDTRVAWLWRGGGYRARFYLDAGGKCRLVGLKVGHDLDATTYRAMGSTGLSVMLLRGGMNYTIA
jgi:hypothetical protein